MNDDKNYSIFKSVKDGLPAIIMFDKTSKNYNNKSNFPWFIEIIISSLNSNDEGLPFQGEDIVLNHFEDKFEEALSKVTTIKFIGRATWNKYRNLYYYAKEGEKAHECLSNFLEGEEQIRPFQYKIEEDKEWSNINEIFPSI